MKLLDDSTTMRVDECAGLVMETVPLLMRTMRREMRQNQPAELSMPQFRTLRILHRHPGMSLSGLAGKLDLTLASASKLIDVLVKHELVQRESSAADRRRIELQLTECGRATLDNAWQKAHARFTEKLTQLSEGDRALVSEAMRALQTILSVDSQGTPDPGQRGNGS